MSIWIVWPSWPEHLYVADALEQRQHRPVVGEQRGLEALDAVLARALHEPLEQHAAQPAALQASITTTAASAADGRPDSACSGHRETLAGEGSIAPIASWSA
jgi:hypothetical protein